MADSKKRSVDSEAPSAKKVALSDGMASAADMELLGVKYKDKKNWDGFKEEYEKNKPFPHLHLDNLLSVETAKQIKREVVQFGQWNDKRNDLYCFKQSDDINKRDLPALSKLRNILYSETFMTMLEHITGIDNLDRTHIDFSAAVYSKTNRLLCHDDELEGRRIAFIYYLVPEDWSPEDGGMLDLFSTDKNHHPTHSDVSLLPTFNSLAFFAVSADSWHQVAEVLSDRDRITVGGWIHGPAFNRPARPDCPPVVYRPLKDATFEVEKWINSMYLSEENKANINEQFCSEGTIELQGFLCPDKYKAVLRAMATRPDDDWRRALPLNRRNYLRLNGIEPFLAGESGPHDDPSKDAASELLHLLQSRSFADLLQAYTGLDVNSGATESAAETRRFQHGHYTLLHDHSFAEEGVDKPGLDIILNLGPVAMGEESETGGIVTYLSKDEELLTSVPVPNALSIVLRDDGVMRFVEFVNSEAPGERIDVSCVFRGFDMPAGSDADGDS